MMQTDPRSIFRWLIASLVIVAIGIALGDSIDAAGETLTRVDPFEFGKLLTLGALMLLATGFSFSWLVMPRNGDLARRGAVVGYFLIAQIIKYLPGRVWGFVYQLNRLSGLAPASLILIASLNHLVLTLLISIFFLGAAFDVPGSWYLFGCGSLLMLLWTQRGGVAVYLAWMKHIPAATLARLPAMSTLGIGVSLLLEWGFYLAIWAGLFALLQIPAEPGLVLSTASFYAGAWIIGSLAGLIPGGLGVREGGFIILCLGLGPAKSELMALSILARLIFTLAETLTGALAAAYLHRKPVTK